MPSAVAYDREDDRGFGWVVFAGVLLLVVGVMNTIEGIAAVGNAHFFVHNTNYVFGDLNTWGWIVLCVGVLQYLSAHIRATRAEIGAIRGSSGGDQLFGSTADEPGDVFGEDVEDFAGGFSCRHSFSIRREVREVGVPIGRQIGMLGDRLFAFNRNRASG